MQKYFVSSKDFELNIITGDDVFHVSRVMRSKAGDEIEIACNKKSYLAKITSIEADKVRFEITRELTLNTELPFTIDLYQGFPKGDKMEDIIKCNTQFGITNICPTFMKRSIVKLDEKKKDSKLIRYQKIAKEAAEQTHRNLMPTILLINELKKIDFSIYDVKILAYEESAKENETSNLKNIIKNLKENDRICIVVGPEGGVDEAEVSYLLNLGFIPSALGPRIFRTEMASLYILSAISYEWELK